MKSILLILASVLLLARCSNTRDTTDLQPKVDSLQAEINRLRAEREQGQSSVQGQSTEHSKMTSDHIMAWPAGLKWVDAPPALPAGTKIAVIEGDPAKAGSFTMRVKIPANFKIMPHTHPADEHITMLEGSGYMGMGEKIDENAAKELTPGAFAVMKKGTVHYLFTKKECILQLHGMGPWGINYVNPADDPRNKK